MEKACLQDIDVFGRKILKLFLRELWHDDVDWIHLAQNRVLWLDAVNTAKNH
jgi:hypothetical protein